MIKTIALAAVAIAITSPAAANDRAWQVGNDSMHIYYDDLNMKTADGRAQLLKRVERAMSRICRDQVDWRDCVAVALRHAAEQPSGATLQLAMAERNGMRLAAR